MQLKGRILLLYPKVKKGRLIYYYNRLCSQGTSYIVIAHIAVLEAFVGPRPEGKVGCHFDDNPANNALSNLRWGSVLDNLDDARRNGRLHRNRKKDENRANVILTATIVSEAREEYYSGDVRFADLAAKHGVCEATIRLCVRGETWKHVPMPETAANRPRRWTSPDRLSIGRIREAAALYRSGAWTVRSLASHFGVYRSEMQRYLTRENAAPPPPSEFYPPRSPADARPDPLVFAGVSGDILFPHPTAGTETGDSLNPGITHVEDLTA